MFQPPWDFPPSAATWPRGHVAPGTMTLQSSSTVKFWWWFHHPKRKSVRLKNHRVFWHSHRSTFAAVRNRMRVSLPACKPGVANHFANLWSCPKTTNPEERILSPWAMQCEFSRYAGDFDAIACFICRILQGARKPPGHMTAGQRDQIVAGAPILGSPSPGSGRTVPWGIPPLGWSYHVLRKNQPASWLPISDLKWNSVGMIPPASTLWWCGVLRKTKTGWSPHGSLAFSQLCLSYPTSFTRYVLIHEVMKGHLSRMKHKVHGSWIGTLRKEQVNKHFEMVCFKGLKTHHRIFGARGGTHMDSPHYVPVAGRALRFAPSSKAPTWDLDAARLHNQWLAGWQSVAALQKPQSLP